MNALPPGVARWTISGQLTADEVWAVDWWTTPGTGVADAATWQTIVDDMGNLCVSSGFAGAIATILNTGGGSVNLVKGLYYRNAQQAEFVAQHAIAGVTGTSNSFGPLQQAFCVTTLTAHPTRRTRGRAYFPGTGLQLDANHRIPAASVTNLVTKFALILAAGKTVGEYGRAAVVSRVGTVATEITSVRYDLRPDVQRRRANKQATGGQTTVALP